MRVRTRARIVPLVAILAAALGGCQTADTAPDTSSLRMGMRLSASQPAAVDTGTSQPATQSVEPFTPHVVLASQTGEQLAAPSGAEDASPASRPVADFTVATTVPDLKSPKQSTI